MNFASLVRTARQRAGLTQHELATLVGAGTRAVWQLEQGAGTLKTLVPALQVLRVAIAGLPPAADLGARVKAARRKRGWSLQKLSRRSELSVPTLRGLERNAGRMVSLEAAIRALAPDARERQPRRPKRKLPDFTSSPPPSSVSLFLNADCVQVMREMESASVDLVVTSPPYNAQKGYEGELSL